MKPETHLPEKDTPAIGVDPSLEHHDEAKPTTYTADYTEGIDVNRVHGSILREKSDPQDGQEPIPLWIITICLAVMMWGGYYLGKNTANFRSDVFDTHAAQAGTGTAAKPGEAGVPAPGEKAQSPEEALAALVKEGKSAYGSICASCHQAGGGGQAGQYPPLAGSEWVVGDKHVLIPIVLHGVHGPITVAGATYNNTMQAWGPTIKDKKMAAILTYIRHSWGNNADVVTPDDVKAIRDQYKDRKVQWTEEELKALKANVPK